MGHSLTTDAREGRPEEPTATLEVQADFVLAFAVVPEVSDPSRLLGEVHARLKPGRKLLFAEPALHVPARAFQKALATAEEIGL
jgi:SAM-dependent methyltransferase